MEELFSYKFGVLMSFLVGARFDISVICYGFLPVVLFCLIALFIPRRFNDSFSSFFAKFIKYYLLLLLISFLSFIIIDYFFYLFFQSHINILFFGVFDDDTVAVLNSVWEDYPIGKIVLTYLIVIAGLLYTAHLVSNSSTKPIQLRSKTLVLILILFFPLFFVGMRGSTGTFTLRREHTNITDNEFVNSLCYNALYSLKFANSERRDNQIIPDIPRELEIMGYENWNQACNAYREGEGKLFDNSLHSNTRFNTYLQQNPPNVIFVQMESMSTHYFDMNSKELNLLGDLVDELPNLYYFKNSLSSFNGTIQTLENFLVGTPKTIISQSMYFDTPFSSAITLPFKKKGYDAYFLTGANISWRNIDKMLQQQGFDYIEGRNHLLNIYPDAEEFAWGVHDGYLMDYIMTKLNENSGKPKFIFGLTISNHTPFEVPSSYESYPIMMPDSLKVQIRVDEEIAYANFYSHQYGASMLAKLIKMVRESPYGENTIIAASGDHNIRQVFEYTDEEGFLKRSVPILFYIPEKYKPKYVDVERLSSHKDIFPTLFNLSLSDASYTYTGDDLFSDASQYHFAVNDYGFIADSIGAIAYHNNQPYYYTWTQAFSKRKLKVDNINSPHAKYMLEKLRSYTTIRVLQVYKDINAYQERKEQISSVPQTL